MPVLVGSYDQTEFERPPFNYKDLSSTFQLKDINYRRQFAHIYAHRLEQMKDVLFDKIQQKWGINILLLFVYGNFNLIYVRTH